MFITKLFGSSDTSKPSFDTGDLRDTVGMDISNAVARDADRRQRALNQSTTSFGFSMPPTPSTTKSTTTTTNGKGSTVPLLGKIRSSWHADAASNKETFIYGPKDERGRLQRWACKKMSRKREVTQYKETRSTFTGPDRTWTQWISQDHGWVAVPKLNYPQRKERIPFFSNMPPIYAHDRHDHYDHGHRRVDRLLDEVVEVDKTINFSRKRSRSSAGDKYEDRSSVPMEIYNMIKNNKKLKK